MFVILDDLVISAAFVLIMMSFFDMCYNRAMTTLCNKFNSVKGKQPLVSL